MPGVSGKTRCGDVLSKYRQVAVTIPPLLLVLLAGLVAEGVEQVHVSLTSRSDLENCFTYSLVATHRVAREGSGGETDPVLMLRRALYEPEHRLCIPGADRSQDVLASRCAVVDDIRDDTARPEAEGTIGPSANRHGVGDSWRPSPAPLSDFFVGQLHAVCSGRPNVGSILRLGDGG